MPRKRIRDLKRRRKGQERRYVDNNGARIYVTTQLANAGPKPLYTEKERATI